MSISTETLSFNTVQALAEQKLDFSLTPEEATRLCRLFFHDYVVLGVLGARLILTTFYEPKKEGFLENRTGASLDIFKILLSKHCLSFFEELNPTNQQQFLIKIIFWLETITSHPSKINPKTVLRKHGKRHRVRGPKPNWFADYLIRRRVGT